MHARRGRRRRVLLGVAMLVTALASASATSKGLGHSLDSSSSRDASASHDGSSSRDSAVDVILAPTKTVPSPAPTPQPSEAVQDLQSFPVPNWLKNSPGLGALTSTTHKVLRNGDGLVDGIVIRIAPQFAITSTSLLSDRGLARLRDSSVLTRAVVFGDGSARVTNVLFESAYYGSNDYPLIVLELKREPTSSPIVPIVTSKPNKDFEYELLSTISAVDVMDTKALIVKGVEARVAESPLKTQSKLTFFIEPMCGFDIPPAENSDNITELCVGQLNKPTGTSFFDVGSGHHDRQLASTQNFLTKAQAAFTPSSSSTNGLNTSAGVPSLNTSTIQGNGGPTAKTNQSTPLPTHKLPNGSANISVGNPHINLPGNGGSSSKHDGSASVPAVLVYNQQLVGISIPGMTPIKKFQLPNGSNQGFLRLAAPDHRAFIDAATNKTTVYNDDEVFSKLSKYSSYLTTFVDDHGQKLSCQGVLIASKYVLTTASCLAAEPNISAVQFFGSDTSERQTVNIVRTHIATHPRYVQGDVTFDTAVVALSREVEIAPIQLDDGSTDNSANLARIQIDDDECVISATVPSSSDSDGCRNRDGNKFKPAQVFCVMPVALTESMPKGFSVRDFVGDDTIAKVADQISSATGAALVTVNKLSSVVLVGLAVPGPSSATPQQGSAGRHLQSSSNSEVYVRVANSATFINAYVTGATWSVSVTSLSASTVETLPANEQFVVGLRSTRDGQNFCGGSLVGPTSVLTAAHCVVDGPVNYVSIGAYQSSGVENEVIAVVRTKIQIHSQYGSPHQFSYDAALLELEYASAVEPVILDDTADYKAGETATMYGYGMSSATSGLSATLRTVTMPLWSQAACKEVFGEEVDSSMICAGGQKGKDACSGDSGSPLVVVRNGKKVLVGIVSAGAGCGVENVPGVYARVASVKSFVRARVIGASWDSEYVKEDRDGDNGSSASDDSSPTQLPSNDSTTIEPREANATQSGSNKSTTSPPEAGTYNVGLVKPADLSELVREAVLDFVLGSDSEQLMLPDLIQSLKSSDNIIRLYSTGDLGPVLDIIARHNQSSLNRRRDRFDRWKDHYASSPSNGCT